VVASVAAMSVAASEGEDPEEWAHKFFDLAHNPQGETPGHT